jgi:hypothetical protein
MEKIPTVQFELLDQRTVARKKDKNQSPDKKLTDSGGAHTKF